MMVERWTDRFKSGNRERRCGNESAGHRRTECEKWVVQVYMTMKQTRKIAECKNGGQNDGQNGGYIGLQMVRQNDGVGMKESDTE